MVNAAFGEGHPAAGPDTSIEQDSDAESGQCFFFRSHTSYPLPRELHVVLLAADTSDVRLLSAAINCTDAIAPVVSRLV